MTTAPHDTRRPRGRGALAALLLLTVMLLPAVLIGTGLWWVLVILGASLWLIVIKGRLWRP
jgi:hypothetical protein